MMTRFFIEIMLLLTVGWHCSMAADIQLKVGLYNSIPDLQGDQLLGYKGLVESGFNSQDHTVNAVVNEEEYSPYGPLEEYLNGDFDMIEIDTATLSDILGLIVDTSAVYSIPPDTLATAKKAVLAFGKYYGYPTLACGNFLMGLSPATFETCPLREIDSYDNLQAAVATCQDVYQRRVYGGKFNDEYGWYLPFFYLDAYVDIHGPEMLQAAIDQLLSETYDQVTCRKLLWFYEQCGEKCYKYTGSYVEDFNNLINDIKNEETLNYVGFSEKVAEITKNAGAVPYSATTWSLGNGNHMLQFTDALVVSKKAWVNASPEKKQTIRDFIEYFTSNNLRRKIALGEDLTPQRNRYLLQAIDSFYTSVPDDEIYQDIYKLLKDNSLPAPSLLESERSTMQQTLNQAIENFCLIKEEL